MDKIVFNIEQIEELKDIIMDSGTMDAIDYIDEIVEKNTQNEWICVATDRHFVHSAKITSKFNIVDVLTNPSEYIDEYSDTEILTVPHEMAEGNILRFLVGIEDGNYYIVVEDDYGSEDIYQKENETLMQTFIRALNDNLVRE